MPDYEIILVSHEWPRFDEVLDLYYAALYEPFGVPHDVDWYHAANGSLFAVALDKPQRLLGSARLLPATYGVPRQVRQVVVAPDARGRGIGDELMRAVESIAAEEGAAEVWLNARNTAYGFYERLGYVAEGEEFTSELTGIPHRTMRKRLG